MRENPVQKRILLNSGHGATRLFRQNSGKGWIGEAVRLAGGSVLIKNARRFIAGFKGLSDLGGWHSIIITPDMVGKKVAIYTAIEVKGAGGRPTKDQVIFLDLVREAGGLAGVARSPEEAEDILNQFEC